MLQSIDSPSPYLGYRVYGPRTLSNRRSVVDLKNQSTGHRTTMTVPRYLVSVGLNRVITPSDDIDHIDGDSSNDSIENLQVLSAIDNRRKGRCSDGTTLRHTIEFTCPICLTRSSRKYHSSHISRVYCCSVDCSRKFRSISKRHTDLYVIDNARTVNDSVISLSRTSFSGSTLLGERVITISSELASVLSFIYRDNRDRHRRKCVCGSYLPHGRTYCSDACKSLHKVARPSKRPPKDDLVNTLACMSYAEAGRKYGVSCNAVRKWVSYYSIAPIAKLDKAPEF